MSKLEDIRRIFRLAKEYHNESNDWSDYDPYKPVHYTVIFGTPRQATFLIKALRDLGCECHNENEYGESETMWSVITPQEI